MALGLLNASSELSQKDSSELSLALRHARAACEKSNLQFTELREQVFTIIVQAGKPIGAYDIMAELKASSDRDHVAPPTVYRTVEFLCRLDIIQRVHSLNAYLAKKSLGNKNKVCALFICQVCGKTAEAPSNSVQQNLNLVANELKFEVEKQSLEILGRCNICSEAAK